MSAIAIPDLLGRFVSTTLTFEELATLDAHELGSVNNPYAVIGLTISNALVKAAANLNSSSRGVALESKRSIPATNQKQIERPSLGGQPEWRGRFLRLVRCHQILLTRNVLLKDPPLEPLVN